MGQVIRLDEYRKPEPPRPVMLRQYRLPATPRTKREATWTVYQIVERLVCLLVIVGVLAVVGGGLWR